MTNVSKDALNINQLSLVMTIPEDIVKACREYGLSPALTETLIRLHNQQVEMQKAINEMRATSLKIAQTIDTMVNHNVGLTEQLAAMSEKIGYAKEDIVSTSAVGQ